MTAIKRVSRKPRERRPARMGTLATLPVFLSLKGKRVIVAGGTDAAAWKAELVLAAGALVTLYATDLEPEMAQLVGEHDRLIHCPRPWALDSFEGASFAIADAADDEEGRALACAARAAGVPVNVIDRPAFCQVQFGSIVNRSPVVVGISTAGAAPILGQAIRRKIETLLPASLTAWARAAQRIRADLMHRLPAGPKRRTAWEFLTDRAFVANAEDADALDAESLVQAARAGTSGQVTLVGAGPGDPELLTLKAVRALQAADVILFDDLVSDDVLELARREAKRMMVGKRGGRASCRQDDINTLMIKLARQGKHVVRLKSGDPLVFGRAGEEIEELRRADVPVTVVPGITAASAMASRLGVSLTHRDHAQCVSFVTGHARSGKLPETLAYESLIGPSRSAIVYMGAKTAPALSAALLAKGVAASLPAIVMQSVSRPDEALWTGTLADLAGGCAAMTGEGPIVIGLGAVFETVAQQRANEAGDEHQRALTAAQALAASDRRAMELTAQTLSHVR